MSRMTSFVLGYFTAVAVAWVANKLPGADE